MMERFADGDGWLTWMEANAGRQRPTCHIDCSSSRDDARCDGSSLEVLDELLGDPDHLALVVSDHHYAPVKRSTPSVVRYAMRTPPALAVAMLCDAAGLIPKGTKVVCCTLTPQDAPGEDPSDDCEIEGCEAVYELDEDAEVAKIVRAAGARLISAPAEWGETPGRIAAWIEHPVEGVGSKWALTDLCLDVDIPETPVLAKATEQVKRVCRQRCADDVLRSRKAAAMELRSVFHAFEAPMPRLVGALSFGLVTAGDLKYGSYKIPAWRRRVLEPSIPVEDLAHDGANDRIAVAVSACATLWRTVLDKYSLAPVNTWFPKGDGDLDKSRVLAGWQQIGSALGVEDALRAVCVDGVALEDVLPLI